MAKTIYKLADESVGFFDRETGLQVVRDGTVTLDEKDRKGSLTLAAIRAGGLIEVKTAADKTASDKGKAGGK